MLILPSGRQLRKYKISQKSGIILEALEWMNHAAVDAAKLLNMGGLVEYTTMNKSTNRYFLRNTGWTTNTCWMGGHRERC